MSFKKIIEDPDYGVLDISSVTSIDRTFTTRGYALKLPIEAEEYYESDTYSGSIKPGYFLCLPPQTSFYAACHYDQPKRGLCLDIVPRLIQEVQQKNPLDLDASPALELSGLSYPVVAFSIGQALQNLQRHAHSLDREIHKAELMYRMAEQWVAFNDQVHGQQQSIKTQKASTRKELYKRLLTGMDYIHAHDKKKIKMREVASAASLSEYHFHRLFKQCFGTTPVQYHEQLRLGNALRLLQTSDETIAEVAELVGYQDQSHFTKRFRKYFGHTPQAVHQELARSDQYSPLVNL